LSFSTRVEWTILGLKEQKPIGPVALSSSKRFPAPGQAAGARLSAVRVAGAAGTTSAGGRNSTLASRPSVALSNLRAYAVLILVAFHSVLAYLASLPPTAFAFDSPPYKWTTFAIVDSRRWFGFDLFCAWQDIYLMSLMYFLSGVFVWPSLVRRGSGHFLYRRFVRLCVPAAVTVAVLVPAAHYATYRVTAVDTSLAAFGQHWFALPFWPSGPLWFVWLLFAFDAAAAALYRLAPQAGMLLARFAAGGWRDPSRFFFGLVAASALAYVPLALIHGPWAWFDYGPFAVQLSRPLHYAVYFCAGIAVGAFGLERGLLAPDGMLVRRWPLWLAAALATFVLWMAVTAPTLTEGAGLGVRFSSSLAFVLACASGCFALFAIVLRFTRERSRPLDGLSRNAYGIYLVHYLFVVWLQYALLDVALGAIVKAALVFAGVVALSWATSAALHRMPATARVMGADRRAAEAS
jgi:peptidoglycan/LPS O-acetylase OafA/YrhL